MSSLIKHSIFLLGFLLLIACSKDKEFEFDLDHLTDTPWGIPQIIEMGPNVIDYDLSAPTIFYEDGTMAVGANFDFWSVRDSRTIFIEQAQELWFVIDLSPEQLLVEKSRFPDGSFLMRSMYYPME